jgi:hypothetical protein
MTTKTETTTVDAAIVVTTPGDRSVGIWPSELKITGEIFYERDREEVRERYKTLFIESDFFGDSRVRVHFADECGECGARKVEGKCSNKYCIENLPDAG